MEQTQNLPQPSPATIMQVGLGFWPSKILLAAVKFELFTYLEETGKISASQIKSHVQLKCTDRHLFDFLDALTGLGFLEREGLLNDALYSNSIHTQAFLDKKKPSYIGGILDMANNRLYRFWSDLENGLLTGEPQNEIKEHPGNPFDRIYETPEKMKEFINAMSGLQMGNFIAFAEKFDFSNYKTLADAGGAGAMLSIMVARQHPHMNCTNFDLPAVEPLAKANIDLFELSARVKTVNGDFFTEALPAADIIVMGNILHDWEEDTKISLMKRAYDALPEHGAFVAIENVIDDDRKQNVFGLMMSLNMLIETGKGFDYTFNDFNKWAKEIGFKRTSLLPLAGPTSAAIAYK